MLLTVTWGGYMRQLEYSPPNLRYSPILEGRYIVNHLLDLNSEMECEIKIAKPRLKP